MLIELLTLILNCLLAFLDLHFIIYEHNRDVNTFFTFSYTKHRVYPQIPLLIYL